MLLYHANVNLLEKFAVGRCEFMYLFVIISQADTNGMVCSCLL